MLDVQVSTLNGIDDKSARLISFVGVLLGVIATVARIVPRMADGDSFIDSGTVAGGVALVVGVAGLLVALVYATITYLSTQFDYGLSADVADALAREDEVRPETYRTIVLRAYADSIRENKPIISRNAKRFRYALAALVGALFSLMFSVGYYLVRLPDSVELLTLACGATVVGFLCIYIRDEAYLTTAAEKLGRK
ncbi:hypothetical protein [Halorussus salinus]|uniref:hypothetical protein n=1 Tax=Halorussus salinus TaxID=1364935 RepID=UPI001092EEF3|nr:hypothetical protein [Halorussus salinus]